MSSFIRYRQTPLLERTLREHISRLKICHGNSIHIQAKAKCSLPQLELWRNSIKGTISQCFSCLQLSLSKATAKIQTLFDLAKKIIIFFKNLPSAYQHRIISYRGRRWVGDG